jgi:hypothetical protein
LILILIRSITQCEMTLDQDLSLCCIGLSEQLNGLLFELSH